MLVLLNGLQAGNQSGTGRYTTELAKCLPTLDPEIEVKTVWPEDLSIPPEASEESFLRIKLRGPFQRVFADQFKLKKERNRLQADGVHFPANIGNLLPLQNVVLTIHDLSFFRNPAWFARNRALYYRLAVARSARQAKRIIADSRATADDIMRILDLPAKSIDIIHLGVDPSFQRASLDEQKKAREKYGLPESFFLFVGTLEPRKNLPRIISAWSGIAAKIDCGLVLAGRRGWRSKAIFDAVRRSPHGARIHFPGAIAQEDLPAVLSAAHAFVWPTLWEGFGLPPLEAMACGVPVLTSNVSSLPEITGGAAHTVDPEDVEAIARGMVRISRDSALRDELGRRGPERAAEFTWPKTAEATLATYRAAML